MEREPGKHCKASLKFDIAAGGQVRGAGRGQASAEVSIWDALDLAASRFLTR